MALVSRTAGEVRVGGRIDLNGTLCSVEAIKKQHDRNRGPIVVFTLHAPLDTLTRSFPLDFPFRVELGATEKKPRLGSSRGKQPRGGGTRTLRTMADVKAYLATRK